MYIFGLVRLIVMLTPLITRGIKIVALVGWVEFSDFQTSNGWLKT
jgi:hypothetical protein